MIQSLILTILVVKISSRIRKLDHQDDGIQLDCYAAEQYFPNEVKD